jgi:hypothetical protein
MSQTGRHRSSLCYSAFTLCVLRCASACSLDFCVSIEPLISRTLMANSPRCAMGRLGNGADNVLRPDSGFFDLLPIFPRCNIAEAKRRHKLGG